MATLHARGVTHDFGAGPVLADVSLTVAPGHRVGVVGPNGTGKSTLLRALAGQLRPDQGRVTVDPPTAAVGLLPQEPDRRADETVAELVARRTGVAAASVELEAATAALAEDRPGAADRYSAALDRWLALGGADLEARTGSVLAELGLPDELAARPTEALSGGQAARVSLAATVLARFDVVLLDEPTNDLDADALDRLEAHVLALEAPVVVVSHDRAFLARTLTHVLELDEHSHRAVLYGGGWEAYLAEREEAHRQAAEAYDTYRAKRSELSERARTQREWSTQGVRKAKTSGETDKFIRFNNTASSEKVAHKAKATERAMERLEVVDKPWEGWELRFDIGTAERSGDVVASARGAVAAREGFRLGPVDLEVAWADRVAILGPNGAGKTTLLDLLLGRIEPDAGEVHVGPGVVVGELGQRRDRFATDRSLLDVVDAAVDLPTVEVRSLLAKFGLGAEEVQRPSRSLSPGERTRANLALFQGQGVNCLVLDEPTNHLDLAAIEQLEQALDRFVGTLLLVTHDRAFAAAVRTTRTLEVADGTVTERR
ncbi:MAG: ABC-F family ATP-binding cassette domain-containing protein [Acidimicrobiales bacterium]|nr:ABC-F family ATP-binding cassette domain-containing protein [Acidimicrobiales bacterium]